MSLLTPGYFQSTYWSEDFFTDAFWQDYAYVSGTIIKVFMIRDAGTPTIGLIPIVDLFIKASDGSNVIPIPSVIELGGGYYKFYHDVLQDTVVRVDSQDVLMSDADRYHDIGMITPYDDVNNPAGIADAVWDEDLTGHTAPKSAGWFVQKIKKLADVILAMVT